MNAGDYIEILETPLKDTLDFYDLRPDDFVFQQSCDSKHTAKATKRYLQDRKYTVLPWPARSPDRKPIEHVWKYLKAQIDLRARRPSSVHKLWDAVLEEWEKIPQDYIQTLYEPLTRRVRAVLRAKAGHTKY